MGPRVRRLCALALLVIAPRAPAQEVGPPAVEPQPAAAAEPLSPPPPPPPLPSPPPPPPPPRPEPPPRPTAPAAPDPKDPAGHRWAPTLNLLVLSTREIPASSMRVGVRVALRERSAASYSLNFHATGQVGVEGIWTSARAGRWGLGLTARSGLAPVSRGGLFMPFVDLYGFVTLGIFPGSGGDPTVVLPRFGLGVNVNAFAIAPTGWGSGGGWSIGNVGNLGGAGWAVAILAVILAAAVPNVEVVVTPPSRYAPGWTAELRFGVGF